MKDSTTRLLELAHQGARALLTAAQRGRASTGVRSSATVRAGAAAVREVPADPSGLPDFDYAPQHDGDPDPGEVVWMWVPYEDDPSRGKDRPVLVLARAGTDVVVAQLSSQDHDRDAAEEARWGRSWMDIGAGDWDSRRRPSEVRLDRLLRVAPDTVRREGGVLDEGIFHAVVARMKEAHGGV